MSVSVKAPPQPRVGPLPPVVLAARMGSMQRVARVARVRVVAVVAVVAVAGEVTLGAWRRPPRLPPR
jgi:hypothetical protein